jgi:hypothetical protein
LKKFCRNETYTDIRSINLKNTAMKKQEMIDLIIQEEKELYDYVQKCIDTLGVNSPITETATARWAIVFNLKTKLQIK